MVCDIHMLDKYGSFANEENSEADDILVRRLFMIDAVTGRDDGTVRQSPKVCLVCDD